MSIDKCLFTTLALFWRLYFIHTHTHWREVCIQHTDTGSNIGLVQSLVPTYGQRLSHRVAPPFYTDRLYGLQGKSYNVLLLTCDWGKGWSGQPHSSWIFCWMQIWCKFEKTMFIESPATICVNISCSTSWLFLLLQVIHLNLSFSRKSFLVMVAAFDAIAVPLRRACVKNHNDCIIL